MEIGVPDDGVYAIIDHTSDDSTPVGCGTGTPCGFRKIKLKLKNTTPTDDMAAGKLVMVAKYHLNGCFQPGLGGEFVAPGFTCAACRSPDESIVVSNVKDVQSVDRTAQALEFTFPDATPIPINATDLYLQVVFRGVLGLETDAVAVTTIDIHEPTYLTFGDHTDYQAVYNSDGTFLSAVTTASDAFNIEIRFNPDRPRPTAASSPLHSGYFNRIAILTDKESVDYWLTETDAFGENSLTRQWSFGAAVNQTDAQNQTRNFPNYVTLRHITPTDWAYMPTPRGAAIYWIFAGVCQDGTTYCNPVDKTSDAIARRLPPFHQSTPKAMDIDF
jgi:hypothetical protein